MLSNREDFSFESLLVGVGRSKNGVSLEIQVHIAKC